jgi:hypothetical protein
MIVLFILLFSCKLNQAVSTIIVGRIKAFNFLFWG